MGGGGGVIRVGVGEVGSFIGSLLFRVPMDSVDVAAEYEDDHAPDDLEVDTDEEELVDDECDDVHPDDDNGEDDDSSCTLHSLTS